VAGEHAALAGTSGRYEAMMAAELPGGASRAEDVKPVSEPGGTSGRYEAMMAAELSGEPSVGPSRGASIEPSIEPSGPVPKPQTVAAGSGPHDQGDAPASRFAIPTSEAEVLRAWNDVLGELEAMRKFSLLGPFQHARVMQWTADLLELGFPVEVHSMGDMAKDGADELRAILRTLGPALKNLRVTVRLLDAGASRATGARSVLEATQERTSAERSKREAEARAHPITKHVLQTFGAQIKEIKTDV
jgi:hypothetical protein